MTSFEFPAAFIRNHPNGFKYTFKKLRIRNNFVKTRTLNTFYFLCNWNKMTLTYANSYKFHIVQLVQMTNDIIDSRACCSVLWYSFKCQLNKYNIFACINFHRNEEENEMQFFSCSFISTLITVFHITITLTTSLLTGIFTGL